MSGLMRTRPRRAMRRHSHFCAERLEARELFAILSVSNTGDSGSGSFRQALLDANAAGTDQIDFLIGAQTINLLTALPTISAAGGALTINGFGATVRRDPNAATNFRILDSLAPSLTIDRLTLAGGIVFGAVGGGLNAAGNVTLTNSTVTQNLAADGGGIAIAAGGTLKLAKSTVSGNAAIGDGGGIQFSNGGSLLIEDSTVSGNQTTFDGDDGGGIYFFGVASSSPPAGFTPNALRLTNSTIHGNTANDGGGGIALDTFTGTLIVQSSTITGNTANDVGAGGGGGISKPGAGGSIVVNSSVVSGNANPFEPDIRSNTSGPAVEVSFSAVGSANGFILSGGNNRPFGEDPQLGPLADNGGPTLTRLPSTTSPLLGKGANAPGFSFDQRGFTRTIGAATDIGATELELYVVTSSADSGAGTLRDAIAQANANPGAGTITFGGVFSSPQTISLATGLPGISGPLSILGNTTAQNLIVRRSPTAASNFGIFTASASLTLANLTVRDGTGNNGGGIFSDGMATHLVLDSVIVTDNRPTTGNGGGVGINQGFLTVRNSTIARNFGPAGGGGITFFAGGSLLMENSTVAGNNGGTGTAGGLGFQGTISASPPAGFTPSALTIRSSTFEGNQAGINGGAIGVLSGPVLIQNSTITRNVAGGTGGGFNGPSLVLNNSIVSGNRSGSGGADVNASNPVTANFSAIGVNAGFTLDGASGNNLPFGANLNLSPLGNFGGPTQTITPGTGSAAINAGSNSLALTTDQRGAGFVRVSGAAADIGATESQNVLTVANANDANAGSLRQAILDANASAAFDTIVFDPTFFATARTISLLSALPVLTGQVTIFGPGKDLLTVRRDPGAASNFRIVQTMATTANVFGLSLAGGNPVGNGGGILVGGTAPNVTLDGVAIQNSFGALGGGISVDPGGFLTIRNSTVSSNNASVGAGIAIENGSLVLENSTVSGNTALSGDGGGLLITGTASANPPVGFTPSTFAVRNSTIANNNAFGTGGGIRANGFTGTLLIQNATITGNNSATLGGGIATGNASTTLTLANSVVSGNTNATAPDISTPTAINANFCAIGNNTGFTFSGTSSSNLLAGTNLMLSPLGYNAGPTQTRRPQAGSPLINAGSSARVDVSSITDQRGPGFARVLGSNVDIGAVETGTPFVTGLFVRGTTWTTNFMDFLQSSGQGDSTLGFFIAPDSVPDELPWVNLNQVSAQFSDPLAGSPGFGVFGTQTPAGPTLAYDAARFALVYTFTGGNMLNDRFSVVMNNVVSAAGVRMGGLDNFKLLVLPGDANRSGGAVLGSDVTLVRNAQNSTPGAPGSLYTIFKDVNGSGSILGSDVTSVRNRQGLSLPTTGPTVVAGLVGLQFAPLAARKADTKRVMNGMV